MKYRTVPYFQSETSQALRDSPALFIDGTSQNGVKSRVDILANVLDDKRLSAVDGRLDISQPLLLRKLNNDEAVVLFTLPQPLDSLLDEREQ